MNERLIIHARTNESQETGVVQTPSTASTLDKPTNVEDNENTVIEATQHSNGVDT